MQEEPPCGDTPFPPRAGLTLTVQVLALREVFSKSARIITHVSRSGVTPCSKVTSSSKHISSSQVRHGGPAHPGFWPPCHSDLSPHCPQKMMSISPQLPQNTLLGAQAPSRPHHGHLRGLLCPAPAFGAEHSRSCSLGKGYVLPSWEGCFELWFNSWIKT